MYRHFFKRAIDFTIALIALLIVWPILVIVAIWLHFAQVSFSCNQGQEKMER